MTGLEFLTTFMVATAVAFVLLVVGARPQRPRGPRPNGFPMKDGHSVSAQNCRYRSQDPRVGIMDPGLCQKCAGNVK